MKSNKQEVNRGVKRFRVTRWLVYTTIGLIALVFTGMTFILPREILFSLTSFDHINPVFLGVRYLLYAFVYFRWASIAEYFNPNVPPEAVAASRRLVLGLIIFYECLFGLNLIQLVL